MFFKPQDIEIDFDFEVGNELLGCVPVELKQGRLEAFKHKLSTGSSLTRKQVPVTLGWAVTDYKCQGATLEALIMSLEELVWSTGRSRSPHENFTSLNVQMGRVKSLAGVWLSKSITIHDVSCRPDVDLEKELERLEALALLTEARWDVLGDTDDVLDDIPI